MEGRLQSLPVVADAILRFFRLAAVRLALQRAVVALSLTFVALAPEAWDHERMLAAARRIGPEALEGAQALQVVLGQAGAMEEPARLVLVNQFFNRRVVFRDDTEVWGQVDYWATPLETLGKGAGDCEDYAITKYFSLVAAGTPVPRLRLVYVRALVGGTLQAHMVLAYYARPDAEPLILDNLVGDVRPASRRPDLTPVFSFNSEGLWQGVGGQSAGDPVARLSRWRQVLEKVKAEGFL